MDILFGLTVLAVGIACSIAAMRPTSRVPRPTRRERWCARNLL